MSLAKANDLKSRVDDLERRLRIANSELDLAIQEHLQEEYELKPGDRIFHKRRGGILNSSFCISMPTSFVAGHTERKSKKTELLGRKLPVFTQTGANLNHPIHLPRELYRRGRAPNTLLSTICVFVVYCPRSHPWAFSFAFRPESHRITLCRHVLELPRSERR